jgi:hypothetical protein
MSIPFPGVPDSQEPTSVAFDAGDFYLSPQALGVTSGTSKIAVGANAEYFLTKSIAVGGDVSFFVKSPGALSLFPDIEYHFDSDVKSLDLYAGAGPSLYFGLGSTAKTQLGVKAYGAARYFFDPRTGVFAKLGLAAGGGSAALFWAAGISFKI